MCLQLHLYANNFAGRTSSDRIIDKLTTANIVGGNLEVSYLDMSAKKGTTYTYTVKAYSGKTVSAYNTTGLKIKDKY